MAEDVYRILQKHLDTFPLRFPPTESGIEIKLLKKLFNKDEAKIASHISFGHAGSIKKFETLETICKRGRSETARRLAADSILAYTIRLTELRTLTDRIAALEDLL